MVKWLFFLIPVFLSSHLLGDSHELKKCLLECYKIDEPINSQILDKMAPLLDRVEYVPILNLFIEESKKLNIYSTPSAHEVLNPFPPHHAVLFENPHIRVSWAVTKAGEQEPPQPHPWKTLMLIIQPSQFYCQRGDGVSYEDDWPIGVYLLDPILDLLSCKNIGSSDFHGLIFEMK